MQDRDPEGYKKLLAYHKAKALHRDTLDLVAHFPKTKTYADLADQMARSGRSGNKNIVEGWKRNTTKEYYDFLGFCIGAVAELRDDAEDVALGVYNDLMNIKQVMGEKGIQKGRERARRGERGIVSLVELEHLKFYPLDLSLPPIVQLYLKAKEVIYLLERLQKSLDAKMDEDHTKSPNQKAREYLEDQKRADMKFGEYLKSIGLKRLPNGQYVNENDNIDK